MSKKDLYRSEVSPAFYRQMRKQSSAQNHANAETVELMARVLDCIAHRDNYNAIKNLTNKSHLLSMSEKQKILAFFDEKNNLNFFKPYFKVRNHLLEALGVSESNNQSYSL